jgi:general secretion pathway protein E
VGARHPLPYAFAKAHTILLEDDGERLVLRAAENVTAPALSEILRLYDVDLLEREPAATLVHCGSLRGRRVERGRRDR